MRKSILSRTAHALVELCQALPSAEVAGACAAALHLLEKLGVTTKGKRQFIVMVQKELQKVDPTLVVYLLTPTGESGAHRKAIESALEKTSDKKVDMTESADKGLIGGATLHVGDERFDVSIRGALSHLHQHLIAPASV